METESAPPDSFETASRIGLEAIAKMAKDHIAPLPKNYAVWYAYFSHHYPELTRALNIMAKSAMKAGTEEFEQIFNNYLHEKLAGEQTAIQVSDRLQETLTLVENMIRDAGTQTSQFSTSLGSAAGQLNGVVTPDAIKSIVGDLVAEAKMMQEQNDLLQHRLAQSTQELGELKQDLVNTREEAMTDGLTGIANRKSFDMKLLQAAAEAMEEEWPLSLLMVDIDHFKKFNDTFGHQAGDQIIRLVAQTFKKGLKGQDTAARYGGEEFAIILPNTPIGNAARVAEVLRRTVATKEVVNRSNNQKLGQITISVGVSQYRRDESLESLIERADAALYRAKQNGRNQVEAEAS